MIVDEVIWALFAYLGYKWAIAQDQLILMDQNAPGVGCCGRPETCLCQLHAYMEFVFQQEIPRVQGRHL